MPTSRESSCPIRINAETPRRRGSWPCVNRLAQAVLGAICAMCLVAMTLLMVTDVFFRYVLERSVGSAFELIQVLLAVLVFSGIALVSIRGKHVTMDLLFEGLRFSRIRRALDAASLALAAFAFSVLAWRLFLYGAYIKQVGEETMFLHIPIYPFVYLAAATCAISAAGCGMRAMGMLGRSSDDTP